MRRTRENGSRENQTPSSRSSSLIDVEATGNNLEEEIPGEAEDHLEEEIPYVELPVTSIPSSDVEISDASPEDLTDLPSLVEEEAIYVEIPPLTTLLPPLTSDELLPEPQISDATSMQTSTQNEANEQSLSEFDLEKMRKYFIEAFNAAKVIKGKAGNLFVGIPGAGKSALIGYLLGNKMKKIIDEVEYAEEAQTLRPVIGKEIGEAETLFSMTYENVMGLPFTDSPGFLGSRTENEKRIFESISMQLVIQQASSIRSVVIVIDWPSVRVGKAEPFLKLIRILSKFLYQLDEMSPNIKFIVTKIPEDMNLKYMLGKINNLIQTVKKRIENASKKIKDLTGIEIDDSDLDFANKTVDERKINKKIVNKQIKRARTYSEVLQLLTIMVNHPQNIMLANIFDNGESRTEILKNLSSVGIKEIPKSYFHFDQYDEERRKFDEFVYTFIVESPKKIQKFLSYPVIIQEYKDEIGMINEKLDTFYNLEIQDAENRLQHKALNSELNKRTSRLNRKQITLSNLKKRRKKLVEELREIDFDECVSYPKPDIFYNRGRIHIPFPWGWTSKVFIYNHPDAPFESANFFRDPSNGYFDLNSEVKDPKKGYYRITYYYNKFQKVRAMVDIQVKNKNIPVIKGKIKDLEGIYEQIENSEEIVEKELEKQNDSTRTLGELRSVKRRFEARKRKLEKIVKRKNFKLDEAKQYLEKNKQILEIIDELSDIFEFDINLIDHFTLAFFKSISSKNVQQLSQSSPSPERGAFPDESVDPISLVYMIDPVNLKCGHTFEREKITKWLKKQNSCCPTCREPTKIEDLSPNPSLAKKIKSEINKTRRSRYYNPDALLAIATSKVRIAYIREKLYEKYGSTKFLFFELNNDKYITLKIGERFKKIFKNVLTIIKYGLEGLIDFSTMKLDKNRGIINIYCVSRDNAKQIYFILNNALKSQIDRHIKIPSDIISLNREPVLRRDTKSFSQTSKSLIILKHQRSGSISAESQSSTTTKMKDPQRKKGANVAEKVKKYEANSTNTSAFFTTTNHSSHQIPTISPSVHSAASTISPSIHSTASSISPSVHVAASTTTSTSSIKPIHTSRKKTSSNKKPYIFEFPQEEGPISEEEPTFEISGLSYEKVPGDGHCLYHAIAFYTGKDQKSLRHDIVNYLTKNIENFRDYISLRPGQTLKNYLEEIKEGIAWADNIEIEVLMHILNRRIVVIGPNGTILNPDFANQNSTKTIRFSEAPIFVYYNGHTHYDAFLIQHGCDPSDILNNLQQQSARRRSTTNDELDKPLSHFQG